MSFTPIHNIPQRINTKPRNTTERNGNFRRKVHDNNVYSNQNSPWPDPASNGEDDTDGCAYESSIIREFHGEDFNKLSGVIVSNVDIKVI